MAIDLCSDKSSTPRLSFSFDFLQSGDAVPIEQTPLASTSDFDFCLREAEFGEESCSADDIFSGGKMLPTEIKKKLAAAKQTQSPEEAPKEINTVVAAGTSKKSFWGFRRSSSCGSGGYGKTLCPLPLLSRSNSAGSAEETKPMNAKRTMMQLPKESLRQSVNGGNPNSQRCYQKPPLKKGLGAYGNGVTINPVLNVSPANLFAIGSMFSNGKSKGKKK